MPDDRIKPDIDAVLPFNLPTERAVPPANLLGLWVFADEPGIEVFIIMAEEYACTGLCPGKLRLRFETNETSKLVFRLIATVDPKCPDGYALQQAYLP